MPLQAAETRGLYEAEVEVTERSGSARVKGMRVALGAVLLKVSGSSRVAEDGAIAEAMKNPSRYVQQYRYHSDAGEGSARGRLQLQVSFDQMSIDGLLREHGFTVWGDARPSTLVWLGVQDGGTRVLVGAGDRGVLRERILWESERRGLPVVLPQLDATDLGRVTTADVWGEFLDTIKEASERYHAQAMMVGRLYPVGTRSWEARWALAYRGEVKRWREQAGNAASLVAVMMGSVTDELVQRFTRSFDAGGSELLISVESVQSLEDYRRVVDYLKGVHGVRQVITETLSSDAVRLRLKTDGGSDAVRQVIALGNTLERVNRLEMRYGPSSDVANKRQPAPQESLPPGAAYTDRSAMPEGAAVDTGAIEPAAANPPRPEVVYRLLP